MRTASGNADENSLSSLSGPDEIRADSTGVSSK
jgi:hypothetical protein